MKKFHLAISSNDIAASVNDYTKRLESKPCLVIKGEYALWRTPTLNLSVRFIEHGKPFEVRHLGWEEASASSFSETKDINGISWEHFSAEQQAKEINELWPNAQYKVELGHD